MGIFLDAVPLGVANHEVLADPTVAEVALAVSGRAQAHGVGTLVLEHLDRWLTRHGVRRLAAEVLSENGRMLRMFGASGLACRMNCEGSVTHVDMVLDETETYLDARGEREQVADAVNLRALLRSCSLVVIGAGPVPGSTGQAVLSNLSVSGYVGQLYSVTPHAEEIAPSDGARHSVRTARWPGFRGWVGEGAGEATPLGPAAATLLTCVDGSHLGRSGLTRHHRVPAPA